MDNPKKLIGFAFGLIAIVLFFVHSQASEQMRMFISGTAIGLAIAFLLFLTSRFWAQ